MMRSFIDHPSPNHDARSQDQAVDLVILHYTGMETGAAALHRLCDPAAKVSAHYLIEEDGRIFRLVDESRRAWHAGVSCWRGARDINARSIGIELVNPGHEWGPRPYPLTQIDALIALLDDLRRRHDLPAHHIVGHSDVAPQRKDDPGEWFPWDRLARNGLGLWPAVDFTVSSHAHALMPGMAGPGVSDLQIALHVIGYDIEGTGLYDEYCMAVVRAFQRHFRPRLVDGLADAETLSLVFHLAQQSRQAYL